MYKVVNEHDGTGAAARVKDMEAAGKTGTVEVVKGKNPVKNALFLGFAPFNAPEVVVLVIIESAESGGRTAAPIAGRMFEAYKHIQKAPQ